MIKAVIFDLDNTLYDFSGCNLLAEQELLRVISHDFGLSTEQAAKLLKDAKVSVKSRLTEKVAASHNRLLYMQYICEHAGRNPLRYGLKFYDAYWDDMLRRMKLFDYVLPLLHALRDRGIKTGILTDLTAHIQYRKIAKLGLIDLIDCLVTSEEAGAEKPDEKIFRLMLEKLSMDPGEVLMIGDNEAKDVVGARKSGMKALKYDMGLDITKSVMDILDRD